MFALNLADSWAPELHLVGVVAGAPPSQLSLVYQALKTSPFKYYLLMAAAGLNAGYGDEAAPLDQVLTPAGLAAIPLVDKGCTDAISDATKNLSTDALVKADPDTVPAWAKLLDENDPGKFTAPAKEPVLIIQGGNDEQIPVASSTTPVRPAVHDQPGDPAMDLPGPEPCRRHRPVVPGHAPLDQRSLRRRSRPGCDAADRPTRRPGPELPVDLRVVPMATPPVGRVRGGRGAAGGPSRSRRDR